MADDIEISVKSSISRNPKRVGNRCVALSFVGFEPWLIARSMNCGLAELNAARGTRLFGQDSSNAMPSSAPACASQRHR